MGRRHGSPEFRLRDKIRADLSSGCWLWTAFTHKGYARFNTGQKVIEVHRWMYELFIGPIPEGLHIDHLCRNRSCVNPAHMEPVTNRENALRGLGAPGVKAAQSHCIHGHPFDEENTYIHPRRGTRHCRACEAERYRRRKLQAEAL